MAALFLSKHNVDTTYAVEQNQAGQDQPFCGVTSSGNWYCGTFDGHGLSNTIDKLREYIATGKLSEFMDLDTPVEAIQADLTEAKICNFNECSGSTATFALFDGNKIKITNCGDSRTFLFRDGVLVFVTEEHSSENQKERVRKTGAKYIPSHSIRAISESEVIQVPAQYMILKNSNRLALTQALGHVGHDSVQPAPDVFEMLVEENVEYVTVSVSDGVTDMLIYDKDDQNKISDADLRMIYELSAEELKDKIQGRWLQDWNVVFMNGQKQSQHWSKDTSDDVSVARMVIRPKM
jgi:serine/threonine protein phosphatase PrpC